jgi:hypothetical protein
MLDFMLKFLPERMFEGELPSIEFPGSVTTTELAKRWKTVVQDARAKIEASESVDNIERNLHYVFNLFFEGFPSVYQHLTDYADSQVVPLLQKVKKRGSSKSVKLTSEQEHAVQVNALQKFGPWKNKRENLGAQESRLQGRRQNKKRVLMGSPSDRVLRKRPRGDTAANEELSTDDEGSSGANTSSDEGKYFMRNALHTRLILYICYRY